MQYPRTVPYCVYLRNLVVHLMRGLTEQASSACISHYETSRLEALK